MSTVNPSDLFLINRNGISYYVTQENLMAQLEDTDLLLVNRGGVSYKIPASEIDFGGSSNSTIRAFLPSGNLATTETILNSADGKVVFSLDGSSYSTNLTVPLNTFYYVDWGTDIRSAAQGSRYLANVGVSYPSLGTSTSVEIDIKIDKMPDPFSFTASVDVGVSTQYESNIISPVETINAPTQIWVTSDAPSFELRVGDDTWFDPPAIPGSAYVSSNQEVQVRHTTGTAPSTTYRTTVNIGYGEGVGEFESADFDTTTSGVFYDNPTLTPGDDAIIDRNGQVFTLSTPTGANITPIATDWQFASDASFANILDESLNDSSNLLSYTLSGLSEDQTVYARARFIDSSGSNSAYAVSDNLTAKEFYFWRFQARINAGGGGGCIADDINTFYGGSGGRGYVVFESLATSAAAPGSIERTDGGNGGQGGGGGGSGAFGAKGGNGANCSVSGQKQYKSGGGGGAGGVKLNGTILAGVGGGGGAGVRYQNQAASQAGGNGASLPSSNGSSGKSTDANNVVGNPGISSSTPSAGVAGNDDNCNDAGRFSSGAGGGGFGGAPAGNLYGVTKGQGGGGGGSWNQPIDTVTDGYKLTHATSGNVTGSSNTLAKYRAPETDPTNWTLINEADVSGTIDLASF